MINEEIARLTGKIVIQADYRPLDNFTKKLAAAEAKLREFSALTNKKFNIKIKLDATTLKAELDKAANAKITFKNLIADNTAVERLRTNIKERLERTQINLKNVKVNMADVLAQRAGLRQQFANVPIMVTVGLHMKQAEQALRAWKAATESKFKLYINADISGAKLYRNAAKTLRDVGSRLGEFRVKDPKVRLSVDRQHLKAEIASVLEQIKREVKIKIDLNSRVTGSPRGPGASRSTASHGGGAGLLGESVGLARGFLPGLGTAYAIGKLNELNQQIQGQQHAFQAVTGSASAGAATQARLDKMGDEIGFNSREMAPSFIKMIASGNQSGFGQAKAETLFQSMTEYGRVMGLNGEEMKGSLRAVEQMMNKDQIMSEELKGQLGERFPAAIGLFAKSQKMTTAQLMDAMKNGKIKASALEDFGKILRQEARKGGALDLAKNATAANQARVGNAVTSSVKSLSKGGFDEATNNFFKYLADALNKSQPMIEALGGAFYMLMAPVNAALVLLGKLGEQWPSLADGMGMTGAALATLAAVAGVAMLPFGGLALGIGVVLLALEDLSAFLDGKDSVISSILKGVDDKTLQQVFEIGGAFLQMKESVGGAVTAIGDLVRALTGAGDENLFKKGIGLYFDLVIEKVKSSINLVKSLADAIASLARGDFQGAVDAIKNMGANVATQVGADKLLSKGREGTFSLPLAAAISQRYADQQNGNLLRVQRVPGDAQRGKEMQGAMKDAMNGFGMGKDPTIQFTGNIALNFPNVTDPTKTTETQEIWNRVLQHANTNIPEGE